MKISLLASVFIGVSLRLFANADPVDEPAAAAPRPAPPTPGEPAARPYPIGKTLSHEALQDLAEQAMSPENAIAAEAIAQLRDAGPAGLDALFVVHSAGVQALQDGKTSPSLKRLREAIEAVSGQRDCHASHLYWFTDYAKAQAEARASGKPILSLRLLGRLDEELSCANSRFFRTTLYSNEEISAYLRDHFVLHWKSVRPVPKITIDFGDGRVVQRTITGNSIHYALDADGTVIDALPGLYSPRGFLDWLARTDRVAQAAGKLKDSMRVRFLAEYHAERERVVEQDWANDLRAIGIRPIALAQRPAVAAASEASVALPQAVALRAANPSTKSPPTALAAGRLAVAKGVVELKVLRASEPGGTSASASLASAEIKEAATDAQWKQIAALHGSDARLATGSVALIRAKAPATEGSVSTAAESKIDAPLLRTLRNLERSIAEDTVRNEYVLHARLHQWLAAAPARNVDTLNARVYDELFLTPDSDPWLGLLPPDTFTALENDGRK